MRLLIVAAIVCGLSTPASAAYDCGRYMRSLFGIPDRAYNMALNWARFPRTTLHPGAVVVSRRSGKASDGKLPGGHVARIERVIDSCTAIVRDNRGTYKRNVCSRLVAYVQPTSHL